MGNCLTKDRSVSPSNSFMNLRVVNGRVRRNSSKIGENRKSEQSIRHTNSLYNSVYENTGPYLNQKVSDQGHGDFSRQETDYPRKQIEVSATPSIRPTDERSRTPESGIGSLESKQSAGIGNSLDRSTYDRQITDQRLEQLLHRGHKRIGSNGDSPRGHTRSNSNGGIIMIARERSDSKKSIHGDYIRKGSCGVTEAKVQRNDSEKSDKPGTPKFHRAARTPDIIRRPTPEPNTLQGFVVKPNSPNTLTRSDSCQNELNPVLRNKNQNLQLRRNVNSAAYHLDLSGIDNYQPPPAEIPKSKEGGSCYKNEHACVIKWKKGNLLGMGSFGKVYSALTEGGEIVAVKQIQLDTNSWKAAETDYKIIQREVGLLKTLNHAHIVRFLDCGLDTSDHTINIIMEHISGGTISSLLKKFGVFTETVFRKYTSQLMDALIYLHSNNVIHRDIKGSNIMIANNNSVKIIDFGTAKKTTDDLVTPMSAMKLDFCIKGTPYWMAPEVVQMAGEPTPKADMWSVGCTVIEMATGSPPYFHMPAMSAMFTIGSLEKPSPKLPEEFSFDARDFVALCLNKDVRKRKGSTQLGSHPFMLTEHIHSYIDNRAFYI